jgi:hypothetical protein
VHARSPATPEPVDTAEAIDAIEVVKAAKAGDDVIEVLPMLDDTVPDKVAVSALRGKTPHPAAAPDLRLIAAQFEERGVDPNFNRFWSFE